MNSIYCTVLNSSFVPRGVALQKSIVRHSPRARFAYYCIDDATVALLRTMNLKNAWVVAPAEFETAELLQAKVKLKINEYCWTCKPAVLLHALAREPALDWAVWLDSDMWAFGDIDAALVKHGEANVLLTAHDFAMPEFAKLETSVGHYNAGYVAFRNSEIGRSALAWWLDRCLEGCPAEPSEGRYADQKYLDGVPNRFPGVAISTTSGLNCAPWNVLGSDVRCGGEQVLVGSVPLLLYHFQGLKIMRHWACDLYASSTRLPRNIRRLIYRPYVEALAGELHNVALATGDSKCGIDSGFSGKGGMLRIVKHLRWARNIVVQIPK